MFSVFRKLKKKRAENDIKAKIQMKCHIGEILTGDVNHYGAHAKQIISSKREGLIDNFNVHFR